MVSIEPHPGGWAAARETAARQPVGQDEREETVMARWHLGTLGADRWDFIV